LLNFFIPPKHIFKLPFIILSNLEPIFLINYLQFNQNFILDLPNILIILINYHQLLNYPIFFLIFILYIILQNHLINIYFHLEKITKFHIISIKIPKLLIKMKKTLNFLHQFVEIYFKNC